MNRGKPWQIPDFRAVSSAVEHCLHTAGVAGSNPAPPTSKINDLRHFRVAFSFLVWQKCGKQASEGGRLRSVKPHLRRQSPVRFNAATYTGGNPSTSMRTTSMLLPGRRDCTTYLLPVGNTSMPRRGTGVHPLA